MDMKTRGDRPLLLLFGFSFLDIVVLLSLVYMVFLAFISLLWSTLGSTVVVNVLLKKSWPCVLIDVLPIDSLKHHLIWFVFPIPNSFWTVQTLWSHTAFCFAPLLGYWTCSHFLPTLQVCISEVAYVLASVYFYNHLKRPNEGLFWSILMNQVWV